MRALSTVILLLVTCGLFSCTEANSKAENQPKVKTGARVLIENHLQELEGKRVGLVMNPTSRIDGVHMLDTLLQSGVHITALFAAEHGFRGQAGAGEKIEDGIDQQTGLPVHSLYGSIRKPTPEMLQNVDILLFDLPDIGARFYTYNSTMGLVLEAATENDKELWILDRPNPMGGNYVAGWVLEDRYKSFVGSYPMPMVYGLTMGEIAKMAIGEGWLNLEQQPYLKIIKAEGWQRDMKWNETGLQWIPPSPNLPTFEHAFAYLGTVLFEGTNISEGRGTDDPFLTIGSPDFNFNEKELAELERAYQVDLEKISFTPKSIPGKSVSPKYESRQCRGIRISYSGNYENADPVAFGLALLRFIKNHSPNFQINNYANKLSGINLKSIIENNEPLPDWSEGIQAFKEKREPYLLY